MPNSSTPSKFVWPPKPPATAADSSPSTPSNQSLPLPAPSLLTRLRSSLSEIEHAWLDPVALPLAQRIIQAEWHPDEPAAYCDRCGRDIGAYESDEVQCSRCARSRLPWDRCIRLGRYDAPLADWICEVKFTRWRVLGFELGRTLGKQLRAAGFTAANYPNAIIVPIPTSFRRRLSRGIDHAAVIARGVAWELELPLVRALKRKHRPSQRAVAFSDRVGNVSGSIHLRRTHAKKLAGRTVLLIDDVMTTGATMRTAARALASSGTPPGAIWVAVAGVTPDPAG
jgi:ComF family protein